MNGFRRLALSALLLIAIPVPGHAESVFPPYGGQGNTETPVICGQGQYVVGFEGRVGDWIDNLKPVCAAVLAGGHRGNNSYDLDALGGNGGSPIEVRCPAGGFVSSITILTTEGRQVTKIAFTCYTPANGTSESNLKFGNDDTFTAGSQRHTCPSGEIATGLNVRWGRHVNAVGLICDTLVIPAASSYSGCLIAGALRKDIAEADCNEAQTTGCIRRLLTKKQYEKCLRAQPPPPPSTAQIKSCQDYGDRMGAKVTEAAQLNCSFLNGPGGWNKDRPYFEQQCLEVVAVSTKGIKSNERALAGLLDECKTSGGGGTTTGGGETATIVNATTVYDQPGGKEICYTQPDDTGKVLQKKENEPRWVLLAGITGDCGGRNGWVWRGDENEDVALN